MTIDDKLITYLEELSYLELNDEEKEEAKKDLSGILGYMDKLNELDTENVVPLSHPFPETNRFRADEVTESFDTELILSNAPERHEAYFKAPKTVE